MEALSNEANQPKVKTELETKEVGVRESCIIQRNCEQLKVFLVEEKGKKSEDNVHTNVHNGLPGQVMLKSFPEQLILVKEQTPVTTEGIQHYLGSEGSREGLGEKV